MYLDTQKFSYCAIFFLRKFYVISVLQNCINTIIVKYNKTEYLYLKKQQQQQSKIKCLICTICMYCFLLVVQLVVLLHLIDLHLSFSIYYVIDTTDNETEESHLNILCDRNGIIPLGMESGQIPDSAISASSAFEMSHVGPTNAR